MSALKLRERNMFEYDINIKRLLKGDGKDNIKTEIWAEITNRNTCVTMNRRIWWEDDDGIFHDGTPDLPIELRGDVDNAWIEKSRKW
jgi:hypothetical protein